MRMILLLGAAAFVLAVSISDASAMGGGNLGPDESPYALFGQSFPAPLAEGRTQDIGEFYQPAVRRRVRIKKRHELDGLQ